jgi:hypothetical protein
VVRGDGVMGSLGKPNPGFWLRKEYT